MHFNIRRQHIKNIMLPAAMTGGIVFYKWMGYLTFLSPYLIFLMLMITYCKLNYKEFRPTHFHLILFGIQMLMSGVIYVIVSMLNHTVAEGLFICVFIPTATAAPIITSMLGGSISFVATYSLICNMAIAVIGPLVLAKIGDISNISFITSAGLICSKVFPLLVLPLICAMLIRKFSPNIHSKIVNHQQLSFYLWAISLFIIVGSCVSYTIKNWNPGEVENIIFLTVGSLAVCLLQFYVGRYIGKKNGDAVSGGQSLGQKNTVLAVWLAMMYMNPVASIGPATYIAWQNIVNSYQLTMKTRKEMKL